ncbi:MAG: hypothetical protein JWO92_709 [Chitinophagaceae bacterium]|nr:hypothetical protein [Chitinophagaceae bacterium]
MIRKVIPPEYKPIKKQMQDLLTGYWWLKIRD